MGFICPYYSFEEGTTDVKGSRVSRSTEGRETVFGSYPRRISDASRMDKRLC